MHYVIWGNLVMLLLKLSPPRSRWHKGHDCQHVYGVSISSTFYTSILQFDYSLIAMNDTGLITETSFESWSRSGVCDRFVYQNVVWLWLFEGWNNWSKDNKLIIPKVKVHTAFFLFSWHMALRWNYCKQSHWSWFYLSLIHIWRCRRQFLCRSRWSPYH